MLFRPPHDRSIRWPVKWCQWHHLEVMLFDHPKTRASAGQLNGASGTTWK
ncbi:hypothetical protein IRZ70_02255 [Pseudomonas monteilii]|nr:hypothetical protein [Pseudomonas monteilii]